MLKELLLPTMYCIEDMHIHGMGNWHAAVLLDNPEPFSALLIETLNDRDFAGFTALEIAYRLNRATLIDALKALGAQGDETIREERGVDEQIENETYVHLPAKQGKLKTLEKRYLSGGSLNSRDSSWNTPIHWLAANGHLKAAKYFTEEHFMFNVDLDAKNHDGNTPRNMALIAGHSEIARHFLIWEIDDYVTSARIRHKMTAGLKDMLPRQKK
jgi:ankyrin repeat protein